MPRNGRVIWFTGLSGSGKSTLAQAVNSVLQQRGVDTEILDGDQIRTVFPATGFSPEDRDNHIKHAGYTASLLEKHGVTVLCAFISPYDTTRKFVRTLCRNFTEIYVRCPLPVCEARDVKGLYKRARSKEIVQFTGIDAPYDVPLSPDLVVDTAHTELSACVAQVLRTLSRGKDVCTAL
jgi:adenylylsulfate kinase